MRMISNVWTEGRFMTLPAIQLLCQSRLSQGPRFWSSRTLRNLLGPAYSFDLFQLVGVRRIELRLCAPEAHVLPVYYTPLFIFLLQQPLFQFAISANLLRRFF